MLIDEPLPADRLTAIQLSHNAIAGQDDPATLKQLYQSIDEIDWRGYAGLDDATLGLLGLLDRVDLEGLGEANLDFHTINLVFLPPELEAAKAALDHAAAHVDDVWTVAYRDYTKTLDALASAHASHNVGNVATALGVVLAVFEQHLDDLRAGWLDPDGRPIHKGRVGLETVFGTRTVPAAVAATLARALRVAAERGDVETGKEWQLLGQIADRYLTEARGD